jgi:hypothetical protein
MIHLTLFPEMVMPEVVKINCYYDMQLFKITNKKLLCGREISNVQMAHIHIPCTPMLCTFMYVHMYIDLYFCSRNS